MSLDNLRHAQYTSEGNQIDDPGSLFGNVINAISVQLPGAQTAADINKLIVNLSAQGGGALLFPPSEVPYVYDDELVLSGVSNVTILLSPGVIITRPDAYVMQGTTLNGSAQVTLTSGNTSLLRSIASGSLTAQYVTGAGIQLATRIQSIGSSSTLTLSKTATASGTVTLTFHHAHNIIRRYNSTNVKIIAPWGRATLNGNGAASPITFDSADDLRNCIRTWQCTDVETSGVLLKNAHYHGEIGVGTSGRIRLQNIRTERNGFRGIHYHGDPGLPVSDVFADELDLLEDGYKAWTVNGDQLSTGLFITFENMSRVQVGRARVRRCSGYGVHLTGKVAGSTASNKINYQSIVCENVAIPVALVNGVQTVDIGSVQASGSILSIASAALGGAPVQLPLWQSNGSAYVVGALMQEITIPAGAGNDAALAQMMIGQGVYLQDIVGGLDVRLAIWSVDVPTRKVQVFNYSSPTTRPWPIASDNTATASNLMTVWTSRGPGMYLTGSVGEFSLNDINLGTLQFDTIGSKAMESANNGNQWINKLKINSIIATNCYAGAYLHGVSDLYIGSVSGADNHNRRTGNDNSFAGTLWLQHCYNCVVSSFVAINKGTGVTTRNGACELWIPSGSRNVKVLAITTENTNVSTTAVTTFAPYVMLGDPRNASGVAFAPYVDAGNAATTSVFKYGMP